ncbi:MAG: methyltransferase [Thermoplasmata archaeon]|jgi:methyltransferase|nr:methyltransferase [Thermoplasmata archaeon]
MLLAVVVLLLLAERAAELALNRRNARRLAASGAVWLRADGFGLILASQVALVAGLVLEGGFAPWAGTGWWTWPLLAVALLCQAFRYWAIGTLGWRWSIRVVTVPGAPRVVAGPYRWVPHPNYAAVMVEALALPLAFGAWLTALAMVPLLGVALARRIRREERALRSGSGSGA